MKGWHRLKTRWGIASDGQMAVIFVVFAITGSLSAWLARPLLHALGLPELPWYYRIPLELILIMPVYPFVLMAVGTVFGQWRFFWGFVKRMLRIQK
jgi:hypothetical protein